VLATDGSVVNSLLIEMFNNKNVHSEKHAISGCLITLRFQGRFIEWLKKVTTDNCCLS
jgi:hypothetical protein